MRLSLLGLYGRYFVTALATPRPDGFDEYSDAEQRREAMLHSFEILQGREGGFDGARFLEIALDMITSVWTHVGTGAVASTRPMLTRWCRSQWEQAAPQFVPVHPPRLTIDQLSLDQAIPGDDADVVEVSIWTPDGQPPQGFPKVWAFARSRAPGTNSMQWELESVRLYERPRDV